MEDFNDQQDQRPRNRFLMYKKHGVFCVILLVLFTTGVYFNICQVFKKYNYYQKQNYNELNAQEENSLLLSFLSRLSNFLSLESNFPIAPIVDYIPRTNFPIITNILRRPSFFSNLIIYVSSFP